MSRAEPSRSGRSRERKPMPAGREARPRRTAPPSTLSPPGTGRAIILASSVGAALLAVTSLLGAIDPGGLATPALVVSLAMFFGGTLVFGWSYVVALGRSREFDVGLAGIYGLSGTARPIVRVQLFGSLAAQVVIAVAAAVAQPDSSLVFDFLAVMWGLGLVGLWGARHGAFPARADDAGRRGARDR